MAEIAREDELALHDKKAEAGAAQQPQGTQMRLPGGTEGFKRTGR